MIRQTFEGVNPATDFAQVESRKQNKKLSIFLTRDNGVKYVVCDSENAKTIVGKFVASYGQDLVVKPFVPPTPIVKEEVIEEKKEPMTGTINYVKDIKVDEILKTEEPIQETEISINLDKPLEE